VRPGVGGKGDYSKGINLTLQMRQGEFGPGGVCQGPDEGWRSPEEGAEVAAGYNKERRALCL
jgi:hypothetical protein